MPLTTFKASVGANAGNDYTLPIQQSRPTLSVAFASDQTQPEQQSGTYVAAGLGTDFPNSGTLQTVFMFTANWLAANAYAATFGGMMTAVDEFSQSVTMGGLGLLTDVPPSGTLLNLVAQTSRTCMARVIAASLNPLGDTSAELTVTFENPSGLWTVNLAGGGKSVLLWPA